MVGVAQPVEHLVVVQDVAGSSPVTHPTLVDRGRGLFLRPCAHYDPTMSGTVDLNADLGEMPGESGAALDAALLSIVTSANVACGGHAGDAQSMRRVVEHAALRGVAIGAHVSYPDREHFGRRDMPFTPDSLLAALRSQVDDLLDAAADVGTSVRYLKAHGALYNASVVSDAPAAILASLAQEYGLPILTQADGTLACTAITAGVTVYGEFFADRAYEPTGRLRSRTASGAVITHPRAVLERVLTAVRENLVVSHDGATLTIQADSVCVHGDTPDAVGLAQTLRAGLDAAEWRLHPFVDPAP